MLAHAYNIIIDVVVGAPVHGRWVVYGFNTTKERLFSILMKYVQLLGAGYYDVYMVVHTSTENTDIILARELKKIFQTQHRHMDF